MLADDIDDEPVSEDDREWNDDRLFGPDIRRLFNHVVSERFAGRARPDGSDLLADSVYGPFANDSSFLSFFYNELMHQDTCYPHTAGSVPLIVVLGTDDRVPAVHRMSLVDLLFSMATATERHTAQSWPNAWPHADPASEALAKQAVALHLDALLSRWDIECAAVRLHLAALAVVFPRPHTYRALEARLAGAIDRHARNTPTGDLVRFLLTVASMDETAIARSIDDFVVAGWQDAAPREIPLAGRTMDLLNQMLTLARMEMPHPAP